MSHNKCSGTRPKLSSTHLVDSNFWISSGRLGVGDGCLGIVEQDKILQVLASKLSYASMFPPFLAPIDVPLHSKSTNIKVEIHQWDFWW